MQNHRSSRPSGRPFPALAARAETRMTMTDLAVPPIRTATIKVHGPEGFEGMRRAGQLAAACLDMLFPYVQPGVLTDELDRLAREFTLDHGALPACLYYRGYAKTVCISPNHVVCHGIPGPRTLKDGEIANIDVTAIIDATGDVEERYSYSPFGVPEFLSSIFSPVTGSSFDWQSLFTGRRFDTTVGFYDFRERRFLPFVGLFLSRDPLGFPDGPSFYAAWFVPHGTDPFGTDHWGGLGNYEPPVAQPKAPKTCIFQWTQKIRTANDGISNVENCKRPSQGARTIEELKSKARYWLGYFKTNVAT